MWIRRATAEDYPAFARLYPELGTHDPVLDAGRWQTELAPNAFVAEAGDRVQGYCFFQVLRGLGYVRHLVVSPEVRGTGLGRRLMAAMAEHLRTLGAREWCLNVKPDNAPALHLYESLGMRPRFRSTAVRIPWTKVDALPAPAARERVPSLNVETAFDFEPGLLDEAPVEGYEPVEEEDEHLERAFDLPAGLLSDARQKTGRVVMALGRAEDVLGVAVFDPWFARAFPFRVEHPALASSLLRALCPLARAGLEEVMVVVEGDAALTRLLLEAGAAVQLETLHYRGAL